MSKPKARKRPATKNVTHPARDISPFERFWRSIPKDPNWKLDLQIRVQEDESTLATLPKK